MIAYLKCMLIAALATGLPPRILPTIQAMEGGRAGSVTNDTNGTEDLGVMQINTIWLPVIAARARMTPERARTELTDDPCFNIAAAALILRTYLAETHGAFIPAIGDYHSHTPTLNRAYALRAEATARMLFGGARE